MPYEMFSVLFGDELLALRGSNTEIAGALDVFDGRSDIDTVPLYSASSVSGGPVADEDLNRLMDELLTAVRNNAPADGMLMVFHGAMAGETEVDPEGHVLTEIRNILGDVPIVTTFDLHGIITDRLIEQSDIMVPFHTYPHIDMYETGQRGARNLLALLDGPVKTHSRAHRAAHARARRRTHHQNRSLWSGHPLVSGNRKFQRRLGQWGLYWQPLHRCARPALQCDCFYGQRPQTRTR